MKTGKMMLVVFALMTAVVLSCQSAQATVLWPPDQFDEFNFELLGRAYLDDDGVHYVYEYVLYRVDGGDLDYESYRGLSYFFMIGCPHPEDPPGVEDEINQSSDESWNAEYGESWNPLIDENSYGIKLENEEFDGMMVDEDGISFVDAGTFDWVDFETLPVSADDGDDAYLLVTISSIHSPVPTTWYAKDGKNPNPDENAPTEFYYDTGETIYPCGPPVPEPATILLFGSSLLGFSALSGKRRRSSTR
jgi:hypothetical protein